MDQQTQLELNPLLPLLDWKPMQGSSVVLSWSYGLSLKVVDDSGSGVHKPLQQRKCRCRKAGQDGITVVQPRQGECRD